MACESAVLSALEGRPRRALDVARALTADKKSVNRILYALETQGKVRRHEGTPPLWEKAVPHAVAPTVLPSPPAEASAWQAQQVTSMTMHQLSTSQMVETGPPGAAHAPTDSLPRAAPAEAHASDNAPEAALWAQQCASAIWNTFNALNPDTSGKQVVAGFVVREGGSPRVVSLGSGTRSATGNRLSLEGRVVHDSHAEVVARRGLLRWLYAELEKASSRAEGSVATLASGPKPFALLSKLDVWLYISLAPCGDAAIFSHSDPRASSIASGAAWSTPKHGVLRTKIESGQGTLPVPAETVLTLDGLQRGDRLLSHSCSDKVAKWAVAGVQGALLSRLIGPLYLSGVVVSDLFAHGHLCRALCCRSHRALDSAGVVVEAPYHMQHVQVLHAPIPHGASSRHQQIQKTSRFSINWAERDAAAELVDGGTGLQTDGSPPRIAKASLFASFCRICPEGASSSYVHNKVQAVTYQRVKRTWTAAMMASQFGLWVCKPCEISEFTCVSSKCLFSNP